MSFKNIVHKKVREQIRITEHLMLRIPGNQLSWRPDIPSSAGSVFSVEELLGHLLECLAGFCAALQKAHPRMLAHFDELRHRKRNHPCGLDEASEEVVLYADHIEEGFRVLVEEDLMRNIPTVFEPEGKPVLTVLLENIEHLGNHKYQLFFYLKSLGIKVGTPDLYSSTR
jgi:hypothetical protein